MSVFVQGSSVIVRVSTLEAKYPGGLRQYRPDCPNTTFSSDELVACVCLMAWDDVDVFVSRLESAGLRALTADYRWADLAAVERCTDPTRNPTLPCDWLECSRDHAGYWLFWLKGLEPGFMAPWENEPLEQTLRHTIRNVTPQEQAQRLRFLRCEDNDEVYEDLHTGKLVYRNRTFLDQPAFSCKEVFRQGMDLITPYLRLQGCTPEDASTPDAQVRLHEGIRRLEHVVQGAPQHWPAFYHMGAAHAAMGQKEQAYQALKQAHAIAPGEQNVGRELVRSCLNTKRHEEAIAHARQLADRYPEDAGLLANLGYALFLGARLDEALVAVRTALSMAPDDVITRRLLTYLKQSKTNECTPR